MTTTDNDNFEVMKVGRTALHSIQAKHGDEGFKYALSIFKSIEENDALIKQKKAENDRFYRILQTLVMG